MKKIKKKNGEEKEREREIKILTIQKGAVGWRDTRAQAEGLDKNKNLV